MTWTDYLANAMLDHVYSDPPYTPPATLYWGCSTTTPALDGSNITEPSGAANYARVAVTAGDMNAAAARSKDNLNALTFGLPSSTWNMVTHLVLFDDPTAGNALDIVDCPDKTIDPGDLVQIPVSGIIHTIT